MTLPISLKPFLRKVQTRRASSRPALQALLSKPLITHSSTSGRGLAIRYSLCLSMFLPYGKVSRYLRNIIAPYCKNLYRKEILNVVYKIVIFPNNVILHAAIGELFHFAFFMFIDCLSVCGNDFSYNRPVAN